MRTPFLIPGKTLAEDRRYDLFTIEGENHSKEVLEEILESTATNKRSYNKFKGLEVGKYAKIGKKQGIVSRLVIIGKRLLIWLEIPLTRAVIFSTGVRKCMVVNYGIELAIK